MATLKVSLPDELMAFVDQQAAKKSFGSGNAYLETLIREAQTLQAEPERIDALLVEGLNSGPATPMTAVDWDEFRAEGHRRHAERQRNANGAIVVDTDPASQGDSPPIRGRASESMTETFELLDLPFSTADAEAPRLAYDRGSLNVRFRDWRERIVALAFDEVAAFSWEDGDAACSDGHRDDSSYLVAGSAWLRAHIDVGAILATEGHRHYKLCFNAAGVLQVIATGLGLVTRENA